MKVVRRTSGGRGEYELAGDSNGIQPADCVGLTIRLDFGGGWVIASGVSAESQGGKIRLRLASDERIHLHRRVAAALLLPKPVRADAGLGRGHPVIIRDRYALDEIALEHVRVEADSAIAEVAGLVVRNADHSTTLEFRARISQLQNVWEFADELPPELAILIHAHEAAVRGRTFLAQEAEHAVERIHLELTQSADDLGALNRDGREDALPDLARLLDWARVPSPPLDTPDRVPQPESRLKRRIADEWRRWAKARGTASARFSRQVRDAYQHRCLICGSAFPKTALPTSSGVDAAHILPWSQYDLDLVSNGIALCKTHHWAFDEGLLDIVFANGTYSVEMPATASSQLVASGIAFSLDALRSFVGAIADERLPPEVAHRPNPQFLRLRRDALGG